MALQVAKILFASCNFLATPYEIKFHPQQALDFSKQYYGIPILLVTIYLIGCFGGKYFMQSRKPFDLRLPLALWNAFLCLFSFIGMTRTVPYLLGQFLSQSYKDTVCTNPSASWGTGVTGFWVMLFIFSKIPELIDTLFIVLRKKPLIFLHWYHHVTVLLFCWNAYATSAGSGLYFVAMNFSVHALMYGYYCLQSLGMVPKSFPAVLITVSQIAQMIVGTGVCISAWYYTYATEGACHNDFSNLLAGALMYGSYLYLFVDFALGRYTRIKGSPATKSVKTL